MKSSEADGLAIVVDAGKEEVPVDLKNLLRMRLDEAVSREIEEQRIFVTPEVYRAALERFVEDVRAVEETFGTKILCSDPLDVQDKKA